MPRSRARVVTPVLDADAVIVPVPFPDGVEEALLTVSRRLASWSGGFLDVSGDGRIACCTCKTAGSEVRRRL
jgi:hypothetical protein